MLNTLYAAAARRRRERFAARPDLRLRLRRPVVSVGNLAVGGRGKTPVVAAIARLLLAMGERPAILSRGYARTQRDDGVVVVRDRHAIRADLPRAGDEPLMLARQLPGVSVLVSADRYLAGRLAEHHLGATVHVLDDGFQHLHLDRDVDLVLVKQVDLAPEMRTLPTGRLREPADCLVAADAILTTDERLDTELSAPVFHLRRDLGPPRTHQGVCERQPAMALAGIASPAEFFEDLGAAGWSLVRSLDFPDHHPYSRRDMDRVFGEARAAGARIVVTTEKDYVRLLPFRPFPLPVAWVPLTMEPDPLADFRTWLTGALREARNMCD